MIPVNKKDNFLENYNISVTSISFCKNPVLREALNKYCYNRLLLNTTAVSLTGRELLDILKEADGAIVGKDIIDAELLDCCPRLKVIAKYGVGLDNIDLEACSRRNIKVLLTPGVNRRSVAEHTIFLCLP